MLLIQKEKPPTLVISTIAGMANDSSSRLGAQFQSVSFCSAVGYKIELFCVEILCFLCPLCQNYPIN